MGLFTIPDNETKKILEGWGGGLWKSPVNKRTIGVQTGAYLQVQTDDDDGTELSGWTKNLDIQSYAHGAVVSLVNGTGGSRTVIEVGLFGKPVTIAEGENGLVHDSFADWESIIRNGEQVGEIGSDYIVDMTQLKSIADYAWKYARGGKHKYTLTLPGTRYDFRPATRHFLRIGAAGETEYIDSVVEVLSVETDRMWSGIGSTRIVLREVQENWKFDSNAIARTMSQGYVIGSRTGQALIAIGTSHYIGPAHRYLTGTDDDDVINQAIEDLKNTFGGGVIQMVGSYAYTTGVISLLKGVTLDLNGITIVKNCDDYAVECDGGSGTEIENAGIKNGTLTRASGDTNYKTLMYAEYADGLRIENMNFIDSYLNGLETQYCDNLFLSNIFAHGFVGGYGLRIMYSDGISASGILATNDDGGSPGTGRSCVSFQTVSNGVISNVIGRDLVYTGGPEAGTGVEIFGNDINAANIRADTIQSSSGSNTAIGVYIAGEGNICSSVSAVDVENTDTAAVAYGVIIAGDDNVVNAKVKGCSGTGVYIDSSSDGTVLTGRATGNGTDYTDAGSNTNDAGFYAA